MSKHIHFLGIAGSGTSAVAAIAKAQGYQISGCDKVTPVNEFTKTLDPKSLLEGHSPDHLKDVDILATTPAVFSLDPNNPELLAAKEKGIEILTWQEFMGKYLEKDKFVIAVCGTHGKSTTTAMVGLLLEEAGLDPTVELGAVVPKWGTNYRIGKGKPVLSGVEGYFVTEADEFNDNFLASTPDVTIVTTIELDHPESFKDFESYKESFKKFFSQTKEKIIANMSNPGVTDVIVSLSSVIPAKAGIHTNKDWIPDQVRDDMVIDYSKKLINFPLQVPGDYNIMNASAVYQLGLALGIDPEIIKKSLMNYSGIGRRFEYFGNYQGAEIYTDFGHHPTEIKVTLEAAREKFPDKKLVMIFQPHMFSRTKVLFNDFVTVIKELPVDKIYIMDIYPSREVDTGLVNSQQLVDAIKQDNVTYLSKTDLSQIIQKESDENTVVFFVGAGDIDKLARDLITTG